MPKGPQGQKRPADVIGNAVKVMRIHKTLRVTPAMEAGLSETVWDMEDLVRIMDERAPKPGRPKTYNKISK